MNPQPRATAQFPRAAGPCHSPKKGNARGACVVSELVVPEQWIDLVGQKRVTLLDPGSNEQIPSSTPKGVSIISPLEVFFWDVI